MERFLHLISIYSKSLLIVVNIFIYVTALICPMPKSSKKQIKDDEKKVIEQLTKDARKSPHEIAEICGFSRQKAWRIIKNLEKENTIWGYAAVIDGNSDGRNTYFTLIKAKAPFLEITDKLIRRIREKKASEIDINLLGVHYLNGLYDWIVIFSAKDIRDAKKFCGYLEIHYGGHIERIELLEDVFPMITFGKINPEIEKLREFAIV